MYVCICNGVRQHEIESAVRTGARSLDDLRCELGVATCCGKCAPDAEALIENASGPVGPHPTPAVGAWPELAREATSA